MSGSSSEEDNEDLGRRRALGRTGVHSGSLPQAFGSNSLASGSSYVMDPSWKHMEVGQSGLLDSSSDDDLVDFAAARVARAVASGELSESGGYGGQPESLAGSQTGGNGGPIPLPQVRNFLSESGGLRYRVMPARKAMAPEEENIQKLRRDAVTMQEQFWKTASYGKYDTVDWIRDSLRDTLERETYSALPWSVLYFLPKLWYKVQSWVFVVLVGITAGVIAGVIDVGQDWFSSLRVGICEDAWYLNHQLCCARYSDRGFCQAWKPYSQIMGIEAVTLAFAVDYFLYVALSVTYTLLAAMYVYNLAQFGAGSGIPEIKTILGGFVIRMFTSPQTLIVKIFGTMLSAASGLALGKEGPMVHIGACCCELWSYVFPKYLRNEAKKREILSAAAAAGVAVAFGTPVGGVLFSLEEVSYYFPSKTMWRAFFCAGVGVFTLKFMDPFHTGKTVLYQVTYDQSWKYFELLGYCLIGVIGGVIGSLFIKFNVRLTQLRMTTWLRHYPITDVFVLTLVSALVQYFNEYTRGDVGEIIGMLFSTCDAANEDTARLCDMNNAAETVYYLFLAFITRWMLCLFTFAAKVPAGLYVPAIGIGALYGRAVGIIIFQLQQSFPNLWIFAECSLDNSHCVTPGTYAMVGAAACLGGMTRMSVALVVIMLELTGGVDYMVPIMIGVLVSKWVGDATNPQCIYDEHISIRGYPYLETSLSNEIKASDTVSNCMKSSSVIMLEANRVYTLGSLLHLLDSNTYSGYPVVSDSESRLLLGFISRRDLMIPLKQAMNDPALNLDSRCYFNPYMPYEDDLPHLELHAWMDLYPIQLSRSTPLLVAFDLFQKMGYRYLLITHVGQLVGICTKKDLLEFLSHRTSCYDQRLERNQNLMAGGAGRTIIPHSSAASNYLER